MHRSRQFDRTLLEAKACRGDACSFGRDRLCELGASSELSPQEDNCIRQNAGVYSASLHKGKPVERRGRKASGPTARQRRIAGLPAAASSRSARRHPHSVRTSPSFQSLVATSHRDVVRCVHRHVAQACVEKEGAAQVETGKPVERRGRKASGLKDRILRQRGCHMSTQHHVTVDGPSARAMARAFIANAFASNLGKLRITARTTRRSTGRMPGASVDQQRCEP
jgi:hypothetical protein